jgi:hypothetical protein
MEQKKLPSSLSTEALENALNGNLEPINASQEDFEIAAIDNEILSFFKAFKIESGENDINKYLIFDLYKKWSKHPVPRSTFSFQAAKYLKTNGNKFKINLNQFTLAKYVQEEYNLKKKDITKSKFYRKHFEVFMKEYLISSGHHYIESHVLFFIYDKWCYKKFKDTKLGKKTFYKFCSIYLSKKLVNGVFWYGINETFFIKVSLKTIDNIREGYKWKHRNDKTKKEEKQT